MDNNIAELAAKINDLEKRLYGYRIGTLIFALVISIFFYFLWHQIPKTIDDKLTEELTPKVRAKIKEAATQAHIVLEASNRMRTRGESIKTVITRGVFWNDKPSNHVGHNCPEGEFLTGLEFEMEARNDVRTPTELTYYCADKMRE